MDFIYKAIRHRDGLSRLDSTYESICHEVEAVSRLSQRRGHITQPPRFIASCSVLDTSWALLVSKRSVLWVAFVHDFFRCWLDRDGELITKGINNDLRSHSAAHRAMPRSPI